MKQENEEVSYSLLYCSCDSCSFSSVVPGAPVGNHSWLQEMEKTPGTSHVLDCNAHRSHAVLPNFLAMDFEQQVRQLAQNSCQGILRRY